MISPAILKYKTRARKVNSLLCVGLDPHYPQLPERFIQMEYPQFEFNKWIIDQTHEFAAAYKPNTAFYEARGDQGIRELKMTMEYLQAEHPDIFTIADAKRGDIQSTNLGYSTFIFDWLGCDAITLNPYLEQAGLQPFLDRVDKVSIILCRTSTPGGGEVQTLGVGSDQRPLYQVIAERVTNQWNTNQNCMLVVGANRVEELAAVRQIVGEMTLLVPGVGAQGGDVEAVVKAGANKEGLGLIINSARGIIFNADPGKAAAQLQAEINLNR